MSTFEELKMVLSEELRDEFQELGEAVEKYPTEEELMSDEEKKIEARYDELTDMAINKLQSK